MAPSTPGSRSIANDYSIWLHLVCTIAQVWDGYWRYLTWSSHSRPQQLPSFDIRLLLAESLEYAQPASAHRYAGPAIGRKLFRYPGRPLVAPLQAYCSVSNPGVVRHQLRPGRLCGRAHRARTAHATQPLRGRCIRRIT
jgi:hypothetical protein